MVAEVSALRRLPPDLDPKQALFFDGLRHAYDIADLALDRLRRALTSIALSAGAREVSPAIYTSAFLDAWAYVDAVDRFRTLWTRCPGFDSDHDRSATPSLHLIAQPIRDLRNVADHIAQRADYLVSHRSPALGTLTWITITDPTALRGRSCVLKPGYFGDGSFTLPDLHGQELLADEPTGYIALAAGEHKASLLEVLPHLEMRLRHLEVEVQRMIDQDGPLATPGAADALLVAEFSAKPEETQSAA